MSQNIYNVNNFFVLTNCRAYVKMGAWADFPAPVCAGAENRRKAILSKDMVLLKILGVDFGDSRTGFAISDSSGLIAATLETFSEKNFDKVAERAAYLAREQGAEEIVVGLPRNMDGSVGERGQKCSAFAEKLKELTDCPIVLWDERLTTVSAHRLMNETNTRGKKRKAAVDKIAAAYILQSYLDSKN